MAAASDYAENAILNHFLKGTTYTQPTNLYCMLCSSAPVDGDTGAAIAAKEATYTGYAAANRPTANSWTIATGVAQNNGAITFPACTGGSVTATHFAIMDGNAGTGADNVIFHGALDSGLAISSGITPEFANNALDLTCD